MSKYKCNNEKCPKYGQVETEYGIHNRYHLDGTITDLKAPCKECGVIREKLEEDTEDKGLCTAAFGGNGNICKK